MATLIQVSGAGAGGPQGGGGSPVALYIVFNGGGATQGEYYSAALQANGGSYPYTYSVGAGLPTGITLSDVYTGAITGTPTAAAGTYTATGTVTDSASTIATCTITIVVIAGNLPPEQPYSVALSEVGPRVADPSTRLVSSNLMATILEPVTPASGYTLGTALHLLISSDNQNWGDLGTVTPDRTHTDPTGTYYMTQVLLDGHSNFDLLIGPNTQNWWVKVWALVAGTASVPSNDPTAVAAVESAACSVPGLGLPLATDVPDINVCPGNNGVVGSGTYWPYNVPLVQAGGVPTWEIPWATYDDTGAVADPYANFVRVSIQDADTNLNPIGPEKSYAGTQISILGALQQCGQLGPGTYGMEGTGNLSYEIFRVYVCNRITQQTPTQYYATTLYQQGMPVFLSGVIYVSIQNQNLGNSPATSPLWWQASGVLQTGVGGGLGYKAVMVAYHGTTPTPDLGVSGGLGYSTAGSSARIACGNPSPYTDSTGIVWHADEYYAGGTPVDSGVGQTITNTADQALYQYERYAMASYTIPAVAGRYAVRLKFSENVFSAVNQRVFSVAINGVTVLSSFDIFAAAGGQYVAFDKAFSVSVPIGSTNIVIAFTAVI